MQQDQAQRGIVTVRLIASAAIATLVVGCSDGSGDLAQPPTGTSVEVKNFAFDPDSVQTALNSTVTWTWNTGGTGHNVTFDDGEHSVTQGSGTYARIFSAGGTYRYHCTIHPAQMQGVITVPGS